jgi:hypothetical protein
MKTTNNLGLKKIELTDSPPDITVQDSNWDLIDETLKQHEDAIGQVNSQLAQTAKAEKAGGTATAITLSNVLLTDGSIKNFIVKADNNAAATTINGKSLYKPGTTIAPKLKIGIAIDVWYDLTGDCFYIKTGAADGGVAETISTILPISNGGTGSNTKEGALLNLGIQELLDTVLDPVNFTPYIKQSIAPANTNALWIDTVSNLIKYYNGSKWVATSAAWG